MERDGGLDAFDDEFIERSAHSGHGFLAVPSMRDHLGDHGIIIRNDHGVRLHGGVDADAESSGSAVFGDQARTRGKFFRVLGVDAALEAVAVEPDVRLLERQSVCPSASRICSLMRSMPVTISVIGCSTWMRVFTSMKKKLWSLSSRNSTVPTFR